jgi:DNA mismatch repair protein MutS
MGEQKGEEKKDPGRISPAMAQYRSIKDQHPDAILLFHIGDFYETFGEDAKTISRELDITLTSRSKDKGGNRIPLAGVPCHAADTYIARLVSKGYRVAICDQVEDAKNARGIVRREVVRIVTPGTVTDAAMTASPEARYLMAVARDREGQGFGLAFLDVSTGEFFATGIPESSGKHSLISEIRKNNPAECILPPDLSPELGPLLHEQGIVVTVGEPGPGYEAALEYLARHLGSDSLESSGVAGNPALVTAAAGALRYARETQRKDLSHVVLLTHREQSDSCLIDSISLRNLEILESIRGRPGDPTLFTRLNLTKSPMGSRLLRQWLSAPLVSVERINNRLDAVEFFYHDTARRTRCREILDKTPDIERITARIACGNATPRDLQALGRTLATLPSLRAVFSGADLLPASLALALAEPGDVSWMKDLIGQAVAEEAPAVIRNGGMIRTGYNPELDELRSLSVSGKERIAALQQRERERTGIRSLKVSYTSVFGYYIEVTRANLHLVPPDYERKQTTSSGERFTLPELKALETALTTADEHGLMLERELYRDLLEKLSGGIPALQATARSLALLDIFAALGDAAVRYRYTRPVPDLTTGILIREGRHPVVEGQMEAGFVPNDTQLSGNSDQIMIITGANMAGKSTYMRAVAEIVVMAQAGSFVPAAHARIGLVDRIFTRVGAFDDLASGQSTFMVEMLELANILNNVTGSSLVILDEIGRGTSTLDGYCIARAVLEFLHGKGPSGPRTLFATHFHEIVSAESDLKRVKNYHFAVRDTGTEVIFLRKLIPGATDRSYGIHVASLAGVPEKVTDRATALLSQVMKGEGKGDGRVQRYTQMLLVDSPGNTPEDPVARELRELDPDNLSPREALDLLYDLVARAGGRERRES